MRRVLVLACETFRFHSTNPLDLAEALARGGLSVTVAAPFADDALERHRSRGFEALRLGIDGDNLRFWTGAVRVARRLRPDVVIGVNAVGFVAADLVHSLGLARHFVAYALELQQPSRHPRSLSVRWQAHRMRRASMVIATSEPRANAMREAFALSRPPMVAENAPTQRAPTSDALRAIARAHGLKASRIVVYAGTISEAACLVEAARSSRMWTSNAGLALVARGGTPSEREALTRAVAGSQGRAVLLPPVEGREPLLTLLSGADAGLVLYDPQSGGPNVAMATPNKLYDALAAGLPVVTNDLPGPMRDVVSSGAGVACDPRSPASIADAVDRLLGERDAFAASSRRLFDERFLDGRHLRPVVDALRSL